MNELASARARVRVAQEELVMAEANLRRSAVPWATRVRLHRGAVIVVGGFATGLAISLLPTRWWGRIGAVAGTLTAAAARSILTPAFMGAAIARARSQPSNTQTHDAA